MPEFVAKLFDASEFTPRWQTQSWDGLGWLNVAGDLGLWSAFLAFPAFLLFLAARKRDIPFRGLFRLFGLFLLLAGTVHLLEAVSFWWPAYRLLVGVKFVAAAASWAVVIDLFGSAPRILALRTPDDLEREIAARVRAEAALRASEEMHRAVVESATDAIITATPGGAIVGWNRGAERMFGYPAAEAVGRRFGEVVTDEFALAPSAFDRPAEVVVRRKGGEQFSAELTLTVWQTSSGRFYTAILRDVSERKRAERELRQADEQFRQAFDAAPIGKALVAPDGRFLKVNSALARMVGFTVAELLATDFQTITYSDDLTADLDYVRRMLAGEITSYKMEKRYVHRDGTIIWADLSVSFVPDPTGRVAYFVAQIQDATARKLAEVAERDRAAGVIRRQQALLALEQAHFPDLSSELIAIAKAGYDGLGVTRARVWLLSPDRVAMTCVASYNGTPGGPPPLPDFLTATQPRYMAALDEGLVLAAADVWSDPRTADLDRAGIVLPDTKSTLTAPARFRAGVIGMVVMTTAGTPRDWTEEEQDYAAVLADRVVVAVQADQRRQAEAAVHVRDRAIEAIPNGVVVTDPNLPDNPVVYVNRGFVRITGYTAAETLGRNLRFLQGPDTDPKVVTRIREAVEAGRAVDAELLNYKKDGTPFWNSMRIAPVTDDQGDVTHFVASQRDMTGIRRLEEQFRQAQKMEAIGHLAGGVAHDFNNLLNIINGYAEMLLGDPTDADEAVTYLTEIVDAGRRAADLTRQLLAFSRRQVLQPRPIQLNDLIAGLNKMLVRLIGEDVRLTTTLHPDLGPVMADPGQVEQILTNLVVNARDAMPTGGRLTIETYPADLDGAFVVTRPDLRPGRYALLAVTDTGAGMTAETKARLFEPFYTTKGLGKGTGLGLATVHGIVKQSGGHVDVYSELGRGTTFKVYLPVAESDPDDPTPSPVKPAPPRGRETILLVEDEAKLLAMTATVLRAAGYVVVEAAGGTDALLRYAAEGGRVDLLLTDVVMSDMGGRVLAEKLTAKAAGLRVLYMSGYTDDAVVRHGVLAAEVAFLQKPFSTDGLLRKVREVLDAEPVA